MRRIQHNIKSMEYKRVTCDICEVDNHRASNARHLKSKKHLENMIQNNAITTR